MLDLPTTATKDTDTITRLKAEALALEALIRTQAATLAHAQKIFARASAAARIGVWECSLPDETLQWTDVVYDIFDLPRGSALDRNETVKCYSEQAAKELHSCEPTRSRIAAASKWTQKSSPSRAIANGYA